MLPLSEFLQRGAEIELIPRLGSFVALGHIGDGIPQRAERIAHAKFAGPVEILLSLVEVVFLSAVGAVVVEVVEGHQQGDVALRRDETAKTGQ